MYRKKWWPGLRVFQWICVILSFAVLAVCADVIALAQDIDLNADAKLSSAGDIVGLASQEFDVTLPMDVSFSVGRMAVDLDASVDAVSSEMRLNVLRALQVEVGSLVPSALKDALAQSLSQADAAIDAIRSAGSGISIDELYDRMKVIESSLDKHFIDLVDDSLNLSLMTKARLLVIAKPIELRYDYLKYIVNKIRLYARDEVKDEFAALLRLSVLDLADGDGAAYRAHLTKILTHVEELRGTMIKKEEADRIRDKADLLLRKVAESGTNRACDVDLSTTIADVDINGGLSWTIADYRAPSKDVRTDGMDLKASYASDDWDVSIDYQQERRDYSDWLKDDDDRTKHSLDISVSRDFDPCSADLAVVFDHEFYPNDIDEEIELDLVVQASAAIVDLLDRVLELHLVATLEDRLAKDLGEEGALGAFAIADRSEVVDCLDDFIGHVLDAEWNGGIDSDTSQALIAMANAILPRRRIHNIDVPLTLGFPFHGGDATIDLEWESKAYPADSPLDHDTSTEKVSYTRDESTLALTGYLKREELVYPNDTAKNRSLREWEGSVDKDITCGDLALTLFHQQRTYPSASKKDQSVHKLDLDLDIDVADLSIAFQWMDKVTAHVNDSSKPIVQMTKIDVDSDWDAGEGTLSVSLSDEQEWNSDHADVNLLEKILVKETRQAELSWDGKLADDLDITLSLTRKNVTNWVDPSKNSSDTTLQVEFDLAI